MSDYATVTDIQSLKRSMSNAEQTRAEALIPLVCSLIRYEAKKTGRDYDNMIYSSELVPVIDAVIGDGEDVSFTLSSNPQGSVKVTVGGDEVTDYTTRRETTAPSAPFRTASTTALTWPNFR